MKGRFGAFALNPRARGNSDIPSLDDGPTPDDIGEIRQIGLERSREHRAPTQLEYETQASGEHLLHLTIRTGLRSGTKEKVGGRVFRVRGRRYRVGGRRYGMIVGHQRRGDDIDERTATAYLETRSHLVIAAGRDVDIDGRRAGPKIRERYTADLPALAQGLTNQAVRRFKRDYLVPKSSLRRAVVHARRVGHAVINNNQSRILAVGSLVCAMGITPLKLYVGASLPVEVALGGAAVVFAQIAKRVVDDDIASARRLELVRRQLDAYARATAIQELNDWSRGLIIARQRIAQPVPAHSPAAPRPATQVAAPAGVVGSSVAYRRSY